MSRALEPWTWARLVIVLVIWLAASCNCTAAEAEAEAETETERFGGDHVLSLPSDIEASPTRTRSNDSTIATSTNIGQGGGGGGGVVVVGKTEKLISSCPTGCQQCTESTWICIGANVSSHIRAETFVDDEDVEKLDISNNGIVTLDVHSLAGLPNLRELSLANNRLKRVEDWSQVLATAHRDVKGGGRLAVLNVTGNYVQRVEANCFGDSWRTLRLLDLSSNVIETLDDDAFVGLSALLRLDLSDNLIVQVHAGTFRGLERLAELDLRGNRIQTIDFSSTIVPHLGQLRSLDLSLNGIHNFSGSTSTSGSRLTRLVLRGNNMTSLAAGFTRGMPELVSLDIGSNPIVRLNGSQLSPAPALREILVDRMDRLAAILDSTFDDLPELRLVNLSANVQLRHVSPRAFVRCPRLAVLDLSGGALESLDRGKKLIASLPALERLDLSGNRWRCDCSLSWITELDDRRRRRRRGKPTMVVVVSPHDTKCTEPAPARDVPMFDYFEDPVAIRDCRPATIVHHSKRVSYRLGSTALLECQVVGEPASSIRWVTPRHEVLHWYPNQMLSSSSSSSSSFAAAAAAGGISSMSWNDDIVGWQQEQRHSSFHDSSGAPVSDLLVDRVQVLRNGNLFIGFVERTDAGSYLCSADNSLGEPQSVRISVGLDYDVIMHVKVVSILVGVATSIAFLLAALVARLVEMILNRFGWCCCCGAAGRLPPKAKHIKKMLESVEHYKKQQLDRLRDNYTMQVQRIKENCNQQMERIRDSYTQQTDRFRDIRDYGTQQLGCMRDQYCDQIKRVRDYSVQQMSRVRENYVFQRNRVRKFRAHQLFKLRENYKVQQMHLNKILENMNLESCRTVCARTDSIVFTSETTESSAFVGIVHNPLPKSRDFFGTGAASGDTQGNCCGAGAGACGGGGGGGGGGRRCSLSMSVPTEAGGCLDCKDIVLSPFNFDMFDVDNIDATFPIHIAGHDLREDVEEEAKEEADDGGGSVPTTAFLTPPQSPADDNGRRHLSSSSASSGDDSFADFDELVTCVVIPKKSSSSDVSSSSSSSSASASSCNVDEMAAAGKSKKISHTVMA